MEELNYWEALKEIALQESERDEFWVKTFSSWEANAIAKQPHELHASGLELPTPDGLFDSLTDGDYSENDYGEDGVI